MPNAAFLWVHGAVVYNWEEGGARLRAQHLPAIFALRTRGAASERDPGEPQGGAVSELRAKSCAAEYHSYKRRCRPPQEEGQERPFVKVGLQRCEQVVGRLAVEQAPADREAAGEFDLGESHRRAVDRNLRQGDPHVAVQFALDRRGDPVVPVGA